MADARVQSPREKPSLGGRDSRAFLAGGTWGSLELGHYLSVKGRRVSPMWAELFPGEAGLGPRLCDLAADGGAGTRGAFPGGSGSKVSACNAGDTGSIPGLGRSPGEGNGNPLQYSCLENPMGGEACWATVHVVAKSQTRLNDLTF